MSESEEVCSICLAPFREPKGLPCLHTFCRECLQMYIDSNSNVNSNHFNCPMCRKSTKPSIHDKPRKEWAKSFPTNNYVLKQSPKKFKQCPTHCNEVLDISCKTCKVVICCQCCLSTHEKCKKTLSGVNIQNIKKTLLAHVKKNEVNLEPVENRLGELQQQKKNAEAHVKQMTQGLMDFISNQEEYWLQEIEACYSRECDLLQEQKKNLLGIKKMALENIKAIDNLLGEDDVQDGPRSLTLFDYRPKHTFMTIETDLVQWREATFDFQINQNFIKVKDELLKENMLDKIQNYASSEIAIVSDVDAGGDGVTACAGATASTTANAMTEHSIATPAYFEETDTQVDPIPNPLQFIKLVTLNDGPVVSINDMIMLPDLCFLISEVCFRKVLKFSSDGQKLHSITFNTSPYGLCNILNNCVAVSLPDNAKIVILTNSNLNEQTSFSFQKKYHGLASDNDERIFALYRDKIMCVDIISKNNPQSVYEICRVIKISTNIYFCDSYRLRVLPSGNILIVTPSSVMNVVCVDQSGTLIFGYQGESGNSLTSVGDIAIDKNFIYIADKKTNEIHRIQHSGSLVDIPLVSNDGIIPPEKIFLSDAGVLAVLSKVNKNTQIQLFSC